MAGVQEEGLPQQPAEHQEPHQARARDAAAGAQGRAAAAGPADGADLPAAPAARRVHRPAARRLPAASEQLSPEHHQRRQLPDAIERGVRGALRRRLRVVTRVAGRRERALAPPNTLRHLHANAFVNIVTICPVLINTQSVVYNILYYVNEYESRERLGLAVVKPNLKSTLFTYLTNYIIKVRKYEIHEFYFSTVMIHN